jgi:hypothetical protein
MANVFLNIPVPASTGSGAPVNVSALGFPKLFSLAGAFDATINIEASNDGVAWVAMASLTAPNDAKRGFASVFVRASVVGTAPGVILSVGSDNPGTDEVALPVPAGNGTGAPVVVSAFGIQKTLIYNGGMEASVTVEISEDGVTFSQAVSFSGRTPAAINICGAVQAMRVSVGGFVSGVGTVTLCAAKEGTGPIVITGPADAFAFYDAGGVLTGNVLFASIDPVTGNTLFGDPSATQDLFLHSGPAVNNSNAGRQLSSLTANRAAFRANQYGANAGVPGVVGFKSRSGVIGGLASVVAGDVLWRATAIGVAADNASIPLAGFVSLVAASPLGGNYVPCEFIIDLAPLGGPINFRQQALRVDSEGVLHIKESANTMAGLAVLGAGGTVVVPNTRVTATTKFTLTAQDGGALLTGSLQQSARVVGTSFTIRSTVGAADAGVQVYYQLWEPTVP